MVVLHREKGVNARLTYCPNCGGEANEIILVGSMDSIYYCHGCKINLIGTSKCPKCGGRGDFQRKLEDHEKLPAQEPCNKCKELFKQRDKIVSEGGILFRCKKCRSEGAINKENPICEEVRKKLGVNKPKPCGIELSECPQCEGGD